MFFSGCLSDVREDFRASKGRAEGLEGQTGGLLPEEPLRAGRAGAEALQSARTNAESHHRDVESRLVKILVQWLKPVLKFNFRLTASWLLRCMLTYGFSLGHSQSLLCELALLC